MERFSKEHEEKVAAEVVAKVMNEAGLAFGDDENYSQDKLQFLLQVVSNVTAKVIVGYDKSVGGGLEGFCVKMLSHYIDEARK